MARSSPCIHGHHEWRATKPQEREKTICVPAYCGYSAAGIASAIPTEPGFLLGNRLTLANAFFSLNSLKCLQGNVTTKALHYLLGLVCTLLLLRLAKHFLSSSQRDKRHCESFMISIICVSEHLQQAGVGLIRCCHARVPSS